LWEIKDTDTDTIIAQLVGVGPTVEDFVYNWPYFGNFSVTLTISDIYANTGSETKYYNNEGPVGGGGGGAPPSYNVASQVEAKEIDIKIVSAYFQETKPLPTIVVKILGGAMVK